MRAGGPERPEDVTIGGFAFRQGGERGKGSELGRSRGRSAAWPVSPFFLGPQGMKGDWQ